MAISFAKVPHQGNSDNFSWMRLLVINIFYIGKVGDWKNHFNPELNKRIDEWIAKHLADTNLKFISEYQE